MPRNGQNNCSRYLTLPEGCLKLAQVCAQSAKCRANKKTHLKEFARRCASEVSGDDLRVQETSRTSSRDFCVNLYRHLRGTHGTRPRDGCIPGVLVFFPQMLHRNRGYNLPKGVQILHHLLGRGKNFITALLIPTKISELLSFTASFPFQKVKLRFEPRRPKPCHQVRGGEASP